MSIAELQTPASSTSPTWSDDEEVAGGERPTLVRWRWWAQGPCWEP